METLSHIIKIKGIYCCLPRQNEPTHLTTPFRRVLHFIYYPYTINHETTT
jgi:hypothetical protein